MMPRRLELDYVARPRRPRWLGYALLAVALGVAGDLVVRYRDVRLELERADNAQELLTTGRQTPKVIPKERLDEQVKNAQAAVRQLTLPWALLIQTLEDATTKDVAILQLQPDASQQQLRIIAEARDKDAMLEYLRNLTAAKAFANAHLINHQVQIEDPQRPIQFSVQAWFRATQ